MVRDKTTRKTRGRASSRTPDSVAEKPARRAKKKVAAKKKATRRSKKVEETTMPSYKELAKMEAALDKGVAAFKRQRLTSAKNLLAQVVADLESFC